MMHFETPFKGTIIDGDITRKLLAKTRNSLSWFIVSSTSHILVN